MAKPSDFRVDCRTTKTKWSWLLGSRLEFYVTDLRTGHVYPRDFAPLEMRAFTYDEMWEVQAVDHTGTFDNPKAQVEKNGTVSFVERHPKNKYYYYLTALSGK